jgi:hypothetical protein
MFEKGENAQYNKWWSDSKNETRLATLEEIQEYLPDGHPDKIKQDGYKVGDFFYYVNPSDLYQVKDINNTHVVITGFGKVKNVQNKSYNKDIFYGGINVGRWYKAKLEEIPLKDLSNEEILEIAKQYYPVGTKFKSPFNYDSNIYIVNDDLSNANKHEWFFERYNTKFLVINVKDNEGNEIKNCGKYILYQGKWAEIIPTSQEVKDDFVLPERWCIEITNENRNLLQTFYEQNIGKYKRCSKDWMIGENGGFFVYPGDQHFHTCTESSAQQRWKNKITTEQFKKYVLGEKVETNSIFPTELLEERLEQLETSNEIYIPTITKEKKKIDYTINSVFADIKVNLPEKPKKIVKSIVLEKFNLII